MHSRKSSVHGPFLVACLLAAVPAVPASAGATLPQLPSVVVTATRTPQVVTALGSAVDVISAADLERRQISTLGEALGGVAGAPQFASGQAGAATSLFLRGANSNQVLFLVDGIRLSDSNTDYAVYLGGAGVLRCDSIEVAHGPQSTLWGGEAVGVVVSLQSRRGAGAPTGDVAVEAGSFGTVQGAVNAQGECGPWAFNLSVGGGHTDNERPNNAFDRVTYAWRVDWKISDTVAVGTTWHGFNGWYGDPSDRFINDPDNQERESNQLGTVFADFTPSAAWTSRVVLGGQARRFVSENPTPGWPTQITVVKNQRGVLDWQNTVQVDGYNRVTAGFTSEVNRTRNTGFGDINKRQTLLAFFAHDEWTPCDNLFLTAGLRSDDHDTFGRATTGRVTAAWLTADARLKFRTSYGTAFRSPAFLDLYGVSPFYHGNPDLRPERARGWDAGVDYYLPDNRGTLGATWFDTRYHNLIVYNFAVFPGTTANVERGRTQGVELAARLSLAKGWETRLVYTYLEADNLSQRTRLLRRPRHAGSLDLWHDFGGGFSTGSGVVVVARRQDIDAQTYATIDAPDYAVARLYAAWRCTDRLTFKARIENLLNKKYEEVIGYPSLGFGAFGSANWRF
ncbi:MAG: TonB-dependent receptor [Opitutaceae bacterium]|nr:TonB-dependent receptor [Opitutaceae bacterium]